MKRYLLLSMTIGLGLAFAADLSSSIETPKASDIIAKDLLGPLKVYKMPKDCVTGNKDSIARGSFIFHNLNGKKAKGPLPKGLAKKLPNGKTKQYGNCIACHNIEGAKGAGNIGPDLTSYNEYFVKTNVRSHQYVYQKIADPRIDNENTHMTINLTTGLFNEREICDITSYIVSIKK
ncbi:MAG: sulfur oxidation c-type cytochrome SoxX [Arcobacter sp.]|nr:MAG: sulfur oxidation c-type cytochrome SoxX [Arcobacter sp.]